MTTHLPFSFIVDKPNSTLTITREFAANRQLVWDCYTKSRYLEQWFAPKPFTAKTKSMDFRVGGHWHYAMVDPDGNEYWGYTAYLTVSPIDGYTSLDGFSDASGTLNPALPRARWDVSFMDAKGHTQVQIIVTYDSLADLEQVIQMGMQEGLTSTLERLDELLVTLNP